MEMNVDVRFMCYSNNACNDASSLRDMKFFKNAFADRTLRWSGCGAASELCVERKILPTVTWLI